jgi:DNA helicase-2/ATP-dependent DNA helicase PcrA
MSFSTRLLAIRIGKILQETAILPERILCFSYTEAGVDAIRHQLTQFQFAGPEALRVTICTFPQFCQAIITENEALFKETGRVRLSDLEQTDLFTRLIDAFPKGHPLKRYRGDVYREISRLQSLFSVMKQEGWTPDLINQKVNDWLNEPEQTRTEEEKDRMDKLLAAVAVFNHYQQLLLAGNRHDADDPVNWVIKAFEANPALLQQYQEQFIYLMADGHQYLHGSQHKLMDLLASYRQPPNVFVVDDPGYRSTPVTRAYATESEEMAGIALRVQQLLQEGVPPAHIGVIYKEAVYGEQLLPYCALLDIPVNSHYSLNLFEVPLVQKIMLLLHYLAAENDVKGSGDEMLFELLHADWFNIPPIEITRLAMEAAERQYGDRKISLRGLLYEKVHAPAKDLFTPPPHEGLKLASKAIEHLVQLAPQVSLSALFDSVIREAGIVAFTLKSPDKVQLRQVVTRLLDFIKEETARNPSLHLQQLVKLVTLMRWQGIPLPLEQVPNSTEGVRLLTAQSAKGLEFPYVFLAGCNAACWEGAYQPITTGYQLPATLSSSSSGEVPSASLARLFHAAIACAQQYLELSYSETPTSFITTLSEQVLPAERTILEPEVMDRFRHLIVPEAQAPEIDRLEESLISRLLEKFVMHVSALNNYLHCPLEFYYKNLVRIPSPRNESTEFGSAVHHALELLFRKMQADYEAFPSKAVFIGDFEAYMQQHRGSFTAEQFSRRMNYGQDVLSDYYDEYIRSWNTIVTVERNIRNVIVDGVPLKGKIDKLEFDGRMVNVVDYKTGDPEKAKARLVRPGPQSPLGGDYWRQAVFYKILVDNYQQKEWKVASSELDLVEPDKKKQYHKEKLFITPDEVAIVTQQITTAWWRIQNRDFYTGCGKPDCHWCNFVKINNLAVAWHPLKEREL